MQITLVQTELESAIREYVNRQMKMAHGMEMKIELTATRGAEGFKATIDINPVSEEKTAEANKPVFRASSAQGVTLRPVISSDEGTKDDDQKQVDANAVHDDAPDQATGTDDGAPFSGGQEASASGGRSLFKGLGKPKNG